MGGGMVLDHELEQDLERFRPELVGYCYRMLASPFDAEDAVQEVLLRAWRAVDGFEGRSSTRTWLYRIASNVCIDAAERRGRRAMPMDLGPAGEPVADQLRTPEVPWVEPAPDSLVEQGETVRLAFITALQRLPARQRAVLLLRDVLGWSAAEVAELLDTSEASANSALQRARARMEQSTTRPDELSTRATVPDRALLDRYVGAFERYDMSELVDLIRQDATQSMPPFDLWLAGRDDVLAWWSGPGIACAGSRVLEAGTANAAPAFGQYKPREDGSGYDPWALQVVEFDEAGIAADFTFFLEAERLFPLFDLPASLGADGLPN